MYTMHEYGFQDPYFVQRENRNSKSLRRMTCLMKKTENKSESHWLYLT